MAGFMGFLRFVTPSIIKFTSSYHDKPFDSDQVPINKECFICLERINNEVVASCNHSFCGIDIIIKLNASSNISKPIAIPRLIVLHVENQS